MTRLSHSRHPALGLPVPNLRKTGRQRSGKQSALRASSALVRAALVLLATSASGCLVPQSVDTTENRVRYPPRIVLESMDLKLTNRLKLSHGQLDSGCSCTVTLAIPQVEELNPTVGLDVHWFADYDSSANASILYSSTLGGVFTTSDTLRQGPSKSFEASTLTDGTHVIDVVIAEEGGFSPTSTQPNRGVYAGYSAATYRFVVDVVTDNLNQCRSDAPYSRTCGSGQ
jgi:hypothetical protein